jgi:hypothetical protein
LANLKAAETERKNAELSEVDRAKADAKAAQDRAAELTRKLVAAEAGLKAEDLEFLTATDETELRAQATRLSERFKGGTPPATPPPAAGTITQPAGGQTPTLDERIATAEKAGDHMTAVALKRERAGLRN